MQLNRMTHAIPICHAEYRCVIIVALLHYVNDIMSTIPITAIESAINYWREKHPADETCAVCPEVNALGGAYGMMIVRGAQSISLDSLDKAPKLAYERYLSQTGARV